MLQLAAARLASGQTAEQLRLLVTQSRQAKDWEDQRAQQDPSPEALRRFRTAVVHLAEAERALKLAEQPAGRAAGD